MNKTESPVSADGSLSIGRIILYNLAGFSFNVYDTILYAWVPYFFTPPEGSGLVRYIPLAALGMIMAGGRILDAVTDPLMGYISDHTRSRWGRRKPYIFAFNPVLFLAFIFIWLPPVRGESMINVAVLAVALFFYYIAYTGVLVPWFAVLPELSGKNEERVKIAAIGVAIGITGALVAGGLSGPMMNSLGVFPMALILGGVALVAGQLTVLGVREHHVLSPDEETPPFGRVVREIFLDRQVMSFSIMIMLVQLTYQLMLMNVPYLTTLVLGRKEADASILMGEVIILMALSAPLWYSLLKKYPKRRVFRAIIGCMIIGFCLSFFIGRLPLLSPLVQAMIIFPIAAIPMGGMFTAVLGIIADITDYDELKTGKRREAMYYGIYGIVRKTGWALCSLILVGVFSAFGYSVENPLGVRMIWIVCALSCFAGLVFFIPFKLGDSREETREIMGL